MNRNTYRRIARITLAALLFSAVSPALAPLFVDRAEFAARILGARPAQAAPPAPAAGDHDHAAHQSEEHGDHDEHAAHGVFCSFCLSAGTQTAFPVCPFKHAAPPAGGVVVDDSVASFVSRLTVSYQPRGPPAG